MSWLHGVHDAPSAFEGVLGLRPELLRLYRAFYSTLWNRDLVPVPARLLELCRLRIAALHAGEAECAVRHVCAGDSASSRRTCQRPLLPPPGGTQREGE